MMQQPRGSVVVVADETEVVVLVNEVVVDVPVVLVVVLAVVDERVVVDAVVVLVVVDVVSRTVDVLVLVDVLVVLQRSQHCFASHAFSVSAILSFTTFRKSSFGSSPTSGTAARVCVCAHRCMSRASVTEDKRGEYA